MTSLPNTPEELWAKLIAPVTQSGDITAKKNLCEKVKKSPRFYIYIKQARVFDFIIETVIDCPELVIGYDTVNIDLIQFLILNLTCDNFKMFTKACVAFREKTFFTLLDDIVYNIMTYETPVLKACTVLQNMIVATNHDSTGLFKNCYNFIEYIVREVNNWDLADPDDPDDPEPEPEHVLGYVLANSKQLLQVKKKYFKLDPVEETLNMAYKYITVVKRAGVVHPDLARVVVEYL